MELQLWNGTWITVCGNQFDDNAAAVACRMAGFSGGKALVNSTLEFAPGPLQVGVFGANCTGNETNLHACALNVTGTCGGEVAAVRCTGKLCLAGRRCCCALRV